MYIKTSAHIFKTRSPNKNTSSVWKIILITTFLEHHHHQFSKLVGVSFIFHISSVGFCFAICSKAHVLSQLIGGGNGSGNMHLARVTTMLDVNVIVDSALVYVSMDRAYDTVCTCVCVCWQESTTPDTVQYDPGSINNTVWHEAHSTLDNYYVGKRKEARSLGSCCTVYGACGLRCFVTCTMLYTQARPCYESLSIYNIAYRCKYLMDGVYLHCLLVL